MYPVCPFSGDSRVGESLLNSPSKPKCSQSNRVSADSHDSTSLTCTLLRPSLTRGTEYELCSNDASSPQSFTSSGTAFSSSSSSSRGSSQADFTCASCTSDEDCTWPEERKGEDEECSTPRAKECRIPELLFCPPAPRKRKASFRLSGQPRLGVLVVPDFDAFFPLHKIPMRTIIKARFESCDAQYMVLDDMEEKLQSKEAKVEYKEKLHAIQEAKLPKLQAMNDEVKELRKEEKELAKYIQHLTAVNNRIDF